MVLEKEKPVIVSVGSAVLDVLLSGTILTPHYEGGDWVNQFDVGGKYELDNVTFSTGGGATNAAVTFARQGLHSVCLAKVGQDIAGKAVLDELHAEGVDTGLMVVRDEGKTGYSSILVAPDGGRTVIVYRGLSNELSADEFDLDSMSGDWLYMSSMAGQLDSAGTIIGKAKEKGMKVAINPGSKELLKADQLKEIIKMTDLLLVNKEELEVLVAGENDDQLVRHASDMAPITIMTDGPRGVTATDRTKIVKAGMYEDVTVIDRLGAGDAFGSGFVSQIALGRDITEAVKFASANSTSVVSQLGAKAGILKEDAVLHEMPLEVKDF